MLVEAINHLHEFKSSLWPEKRLGVIKKRAGNLAIAAASLGLVAASGCFLRDAGEHQQHLNSYSSLGTPKPALVEFLQDFHRNKRDTDIFISCIFLGLSGLFAAIPVCSRFERKEFFKAANASIQTETRLFDHEDQVRIYFDLMLDNHVGTLDIEKAQYPNPYHELSRFSAN